MRIAEPDVGVVLKVGLAHAGEFGGIEATQRAKSEMVTDLPASATALLNVDDDRVASMRDLTAAQVVGFGTSADADYRITGIETDRSGTRFTLTAPPVPAGDRLQTEAEREARITSTCASRSWVSTTR